MIKVNVDHAFELAANKKLSKEMRQKVRQIIIYNLYKGNDEYMILSEKEAELFKMKEIGKVDLFVKIANLENSNKVNKQELIKKIFEVINAIYKEEQETKKYISSISLDKLPIEVRNLFMDNNISKI